MFGNFRIKIPYNLGLVLNILTIVKLFEILSNHYFTFAPLNQNIMIMKKIAVVFSLMMILTSCTQVKIAYVDLEEIMKEYEGSKQAEEEMKAQSEQMSRQLDQLAIPFQQKVQEYQQNQKNLFCICTTGTRKSIDARTTGDPTTTTDGSTTSSS